MAEEINYTFKEWLLIAKEMLIATPYWWLSILTLILGVIYYILDFPLKDSVVVFTSINLIIASVITFIK